MDKHKDILKDIQPQLNNYCDLIRSGVEVNSAMRSAFPDLDETYVRIRASLLDECLKLAFTMGETHAIMKRSGATQKTDQEAKEDCLKQINQLI